MVSEGEPSVTERVEDVESVPDKESDKLFVSVTVSVTDFESLTDKVSVELLLGLEVEESESVVETLSESVFVSEKVLEAVFEADSLQLSVMVREKVPSDSEREADSDCVIEREGVSLTVSLAVVVSESENVGVRESVSV